MARIASLIAIALLCAGCGAAPAQNVPRDSGGPLLPEQAAYDVTFYDLDLRVQPDAQRIDGTVTVHATATAPLEQFVLNLDRLLQVRTVTQQTEGERRMLNVERRADSNQVWIDLPRPVEAGETVRLTVGYGGTPRVAPNPPWDGGFTWAETPGGAPWIATSCQTIGADVWWPVKDHPSDEPDSMAIHVTVPDSLVVAANGTLRGTAQPANGWQTYRWFASTPINSYAVALNIAPYATIDTTYRSVSETPIPVSFFVLPDEERAARRVLPDLLDQVRFLEETLRPYPFAADKYGIARTPFLGMEHQTIIAHGSPLGSTNSLGYEAGFDALHFHELAHEWFGNYVTVRDWKDFWIHEGFATYLEALYAEELRGDSGYAAITDYFRRQITNRQPIARREPAAVSQLYGRDIYFKGAMVLHTLRHFIGDDTFFAFLRRMAGRQADQPVHVTTDDVIRIAEEEAGRDLGWFFDAYLYHAELPRLVTARSENELGLRWESPSEMPFVLPVEVQIDGANRVVSMDGGVAVLDVPPEASVSINPANDALHQSTGD
jgi:aminopeptidase N